MTDEWTVMSSKYTGKCNKCLKAYGVGQNIWVCNKQYYDSLECLMAQYPQATERQKGSPSSSTPASTSTPQSTSTSTHKRYATDGTYSNELPFVACEVCGGTTYNPIMQRQADWSMVPTCMDCDWLMRAQFALKCKGLWRPTPKPEAKT